MAAIAADVLASPTGRALPLAPAELTDPAAFQELLRQGGCAADVLPQRLRSVHTSRHHSPSSNCRNTIFQLTWQETASGPHAPHSLFVKQPCADLSTRLFANLIGFWEIECAFCRSLAAKVPIAVPRIYAVAQRRSRFAIVMENLLERPDTRLFVNRHLLEGIDLDRATRCLRTLARLHAGFSGTSAAARERALPLDLHPFLSPTRLPVMLAVNRLAAAPCQRRAPDLFDDACAALYRRGLSHWGALCRAWYREPLTLVHGDSHLGNFFETGDEMGMLDFQGAHWSQGMRDVQYLLIHSMQPRLLERHERDLVVGYAEEVSRLGAPLSPEQAWDQYRGFSFQSLMTAVVSLGLGSFTDSDAVIHTMLERSVTAVRRLDFAGWLDDLPSTSAP
jgi:hypothetical protein